VAYIQDMGETGYKTWLTYKVSIESAKWKYARKTEEKNYNEFG